MSSLLRIKIKGKNFVVFGTANLSFQREISSTKDAVISFSNSSGQVLAAGQILYSIGTSGNVGYLSVKSKNNITLTGAGTLTLSVENYPTATQVNNTLSFLYDDSAININLVYNSNPVTADVIVETDNRIPYEFKAADFTGSFSDYDGDAIKEVAIFGSVQDLNYNGSPYVSGTKIPIINIQNLVYTPLDQDDMYEMDWTWEATDINGNESN